MAIRSIFVPLALFFVAASTLGGPPPIPVDIDSSTPGGTVTRGGDPFRLLGTPISVGRPLPSVGLYSNNLKRVDLSERRGRVMLISVVPSIDTGGCEQATHLLGEKQNVGDQVDRITISRDLPFAQKRFRDETGFNDVLFLSDFQNGDFGMQTGLLVEKIRLLARTIMVVDQDGIVRYLQVVPETGHLPDMERAFAFARQLAGQ